jgi:hypothetical protein
MKTLPLWILLLLLCFSPVRSGGGQVWLESESTSLGDGWFRYRIGTRAVPFIKELLLTGAAVPFTNLQEVATPPAGWRFTNDVWASWSVTSMTNYWQIRPYDAVFEARSASTNFRTDLGITFVSLSLNDFGYPNVYSVNIVGYIKFPMLVPCLPEEADGSPPNLYTNIFFPDIEINELLRTGDAITGVQFTYENPGTFVLEATTNMTEWLRASYLHGNGGVTTWQSSSDLRRWGSFFRLAYVSESQIPFTDLPPLDSPIAPRMTPPTPAKSLRPVASFTPGQLRLQLDSTPGRTYRIEVQARGQVVWAVDKTATANTLAVLIPSDGLPTSGRIYSRELP